MTKPRLLDLFSGAGGAARGYQQAGFHVTGVDLRPQPRYAGDVFVQGDALEYLAEHGHEFDAIHASPPCQAFSPLAARHPHKTYPNLLPQTREGLIATGKPYVIENVPGAPLGHWVFLCGAMFGLRVYRHRRFETRDLLWQPAHPKHTAACGSGRGQTQRKAHYLAGGNVTITGNVGTYCSGAMEIEWMNGDELSQAIPPAYTRWIGERLLATLTRPVAAPGAE